MAPVTPSDMVKSRVRKGGMKIMKKNLWNNNYRGAETLKRGFNAGTCSVSSERGRLANFHCVQKVLNSDLVNAESLSVLICWAY